MEKKNCAVEKDRKNCWLISEIIKFRKLIFPAHNAALEHETSSWEETLEHYHSKKKLPTSLKVVIVKQVKKLNFQPTNFPKSSH